MQTGKISKSKSNQKFTVIPNEILQEKELSWKAKGLICYLLSLPDDWVLYKTELQNHSTDGRDSTTAGFNELVSKGYIEVEEIRNNGQFSGFNYLVHNTPIAEKPITDLPITGNPISGNPQLQKKQNTKTE